MHFSRFAVEARQPSRSEMRHLLGKFREAALLLTRALGQAAICEFLEAAPAGPMENISSLDHSLRDLAARADRASKAPSLVNEAGKTKAGRGRAAAGAISNCLLYARDARVDWSWWRNLDSSRLRPFISAGDGDAVAVKRHSRRTSLAQLGHSRGHGHRRRSGAARCQRMTVSGFTIIKASGAIR
jgi:hypothetical protein